MYDAKRTISLLHFQTNAVLSSFSHQIEGYPFGSLVLYDVSEKNEPVFFVSTISEHYKNIQTNPRVSLFITDPYGAHDPQRYGRVTITGDAEIVSDEERSIFDASYKERFPGAASSEMAHSFKYVRLQAQAVRWIGGFGAMGWKGADEMPDFECDPVTYIGQRIVTHMNLDHADALPDLAKLADEKLEKGECIEMSFIDSSSFELQIRSETRSRRVSIDFSKPCTDSTAVRKEIISLLNKAREG
jgi:hypothetical protein